MFGHKSFLRIGALSDSSISGLYKDSYELESCSFGFSQGVDTNGKPQTEVRGGSIYVTYGGLPQDDINISFGQSVDQKGQPQDEVRGGRMLVCFLPRTQFYNDAVKNGKFVYEQNGYYVTQSNRFYGNQYQSASRTARYKANFNKAIKFNNMVSGVSTATSISSLGFNISDVIHGEINEFTYPDIGVGALGLMEGSASLAGVSVTPVIGEFVFIYGVTRFSWDMGVKYGPSRWGGFYREYKERKRREELIELIMKDSHEAK